MTCDVALIERVDDDAANVERRHLHGGDGLLVRDLRPEPGPSHPGVEQKLWRISVSGCMLSPLMVIRPLMLGRAARRGGYASQIAAR